MFKSVLQHIDYIINVKFIDNVLLTYLSYPFKTSSEINYLSRVADEYYSKQTQRGDLTTWESIDDVPIFSKTKLELPPVNVPGKFRLPWIKLSQARKKKAKGGHTPRPSVPRLVYHVFSIIVNPLTAGVAYIRVFIFITTFSTTFWTC